MEGKLVKFSDCYRPDAMVMSVNMVEDLCWAEIEKIGFDIVKLMDYYSEQLGKQRSISLGNYVYFPILYRKNTTKMMVSDCSITYAGTVVIESDYMVKGWVDSKDVNLVQTDYLVRLVNYTYRRVFKYKEFENNIGNRTYLIDLGILLAILNGFREEIKKNPEIMNF